MHTDIPPLRKRTKEGALYTRPAEIEKIITESFDFSFEDFVDRARIADRRHPDYLPSEVLVHRIRATRHNNSDQQFNALYPLLSERVLRTCPSASTHAGGKIGEIGKIMDIREFVIERFVTFILIDRNNYEEKLDIFEVRFDRAVMLLRRDAFRNVSRRDNPLTPLEYNESGDIPDDIEASFAQLKPRSLTEEEEITYRFQIRQAIDSLPDMERRVIDMLLAEIPIESNDPNEPSISGRLNCTPKTVRNRRDRALGRIREQLGLDIHHAS